MQVVRCNSCGWIGRDDDIGIETENDPGTEYCQVCHCTDALMDVVYGCNFDDDELRKLWELFDDIPVDHDDCIQEEFLDFPIETNRIEIWYWFDQRYSVGVSVLLNTGYEYVMFSWNTEKEKYEQMGRPMKSEQLARNRFYEYVQKDWFNKCYDTSRAVMKRRMITMFASEWEELD